MLDTYFDLLGIDGAPEDEPEIDAELERVKAMVGEAYGADPPPVFLEAFRVLRTPERREVYRQMVTYAHIGAFLDLEEDAVALSGSPALLHFGIKTVMDDTKAVLVNLGVPEPPLPRRTGLR